MLIDQDSLKNSLSQKFHYEELIQKAQIMKFFKFGPFQASFSHFLFIYVFFINFLTQFNSIL